MPFLIIRFSLTPFKYPFTPLLNMPNYIWLEIKKETSIS